MVSLILLSAALYLLARRNPLFGLFLGLATLGKYPTLILVPMLLLLVRPRKILYGVVLFLVAISPWLIFSQVYFHNALASYGMSFAIEGYNKLAFWLSPWAYATLLGYPAVFAVMIGITVYKKRNPAAASIRRAFARARSLKRIYEDDRLYHFAIAAVFFALAATLYIGPYGDTFTQVRYGYLLSASAGLLVALAMNGARRYTSVNLPLAAAAAAIVLLLLSLAIYLHGASIPAQLNANSNVLSKAAGTLNALGYGGCRVVTNDWVYMLWHNISAFSPFYYNQTSERYPILVFYNWSAATNGNAVQELQAAVAIYSSANFSILLPSGYECIVG